MFVRTLLSHRRQRIAAVVTLASLAAVAPGGAGATLFAQDAPATEDSASPQAAGNVDEAPFLGWPDLRYAQSPEVPAEMQSLDLFAPEGAKELPVVVFIHGGAWSAGDKRSGLNWKPAFFTMHGFLFVSLNYRLAPAFSFEAQIEDVATAVAWLHAHVAEYGGDPRRLVLMGHSSGAQLAALLAMDERRLGAQGLGLADLSGAVLLDGACYDIPQRVAEEPTSRARLEMVFGPDEKVWRDASPLFHVAAKKGIPPCMLVHVSAREISNDESLGMSAALEAARVPTELVPVADRSHVTLNRDLGAPDDATSLTVLRFLLEVTRPRPPRSARHLGPF